MIGSAVPNPEDVQRAVEKIISSQTFGRSKRSVQILTYVVDEDMEGRGDLISGITIAQDVLNRDERFDSGDDSIVRVLAGSLRKKLAEYYREEGQDDPLIITIPKGSYRPHYAIRNQSVENIEPPSFEEIAPKMTKGKISKVAILTAAMATLLIAFIGYQAYFINKLSKANLSNPIITAKDYPSIAVLPFKDMTPNLEHEYIEKSFQQQLATDLYQFRVVRVTTTNKTLAELVAKYPDDIDYAVNGMFLSISPKIELSIDLIELSSGETVMSKRISRDLGDNNYFGILAEISSRISNEFAGQEGEIVERELDLMRARIRTNQYLSGEEGAFDCYAKFLQFGNTKDLDFLRPAFECTREQMKLNPADGTMIIANAYMMFQSSSSKSTISLNLREDYPVISVENALKLGQEATQIDPYNDFTYSLLGTLQVNSGDLKAGIETVQKSVDINPGNHLNLSALALYLAYDGQWSRALEMAQQGLDRNPKPEPYTVLVPYFRALLDRDRDALQLLLREFEEKDDYLKTVFVFPAYSILGDKEALAKYKPRILDHAMRNNGDPLTGIRRNVPSDEIIKVISEEMRLRRIEIP